MSALESMRVGIVVERREIESRWADFTWERTDRVEGLRSAAGIEAGEPLRSSR